MEPSSQVRWLTTGSVSLVITVLLIVLRAPFVLVVVADAGIGIGLGGALVLIATNRDGAATYWASRIIRDGARPWDQLPRLSRLVRAAALLALLMLAATLVFAVVNQAHELYDL